VVQFSWGVEASCADGWCAGCDVYSCEVTLIDGARGRGLALVPRARAHLGDI